MFLRFRFVLERLNNNEARKYSLLPTIQGLLYPAASPSFLAVVFDVPGKAQGVPKEAETCVSPALCGVAWHAWDVPC